MRTDIENIEDELNFVCGKLRDYIVSGKRIPDTLKQKMRAHTGGTRRILEQVVLDLFCTYQEEDEELPEYCGEDIPWETKPKPPGWKQPVIVLGPGEPDGKIIMVEPTSTKGEDLPW